MKKILVIMCAMACLVIAGCSSDDEKVLSPEDPKIKSIKIAESNKRRRKKVLCVETGDIFDCVEDAGLWCGYKGSYIGDCRR